MAARTFTEATLIQHYSTASTLSARGPYRASLLRGNRPGPWPPNALLATPLAAKLLGVSVRQMERWRKLQIGPAHEPRGKWRGNVVRYHLAHLLAFRNRVLR